MSFIELTDIHKYYNLNTDAEVHALRGITLGIEKGELVAIMGPSGSGKSTLLHILGCLDTSTAGEYFLDGSNVSKFNNKMLAEVRNKKVGFILQEFGLIQNETALENVAIPLLISKLRLSQVWNKCLSVLDSLEMSRYSKKKVNELSGGQRQRVAIARALVNDPEVILADEPTGALDTKMSNEIMRIFQKLNEEGKTIIIVTHNPDIAAQCQKTIQIVDGKIIE